MKTSQMFRIFTMVLNPQTGLELCQTSSELAKHTEYQIAQTWLQHQISTSPITEGEINKDDNTYQIESEQLLQKFLRNMKIMTK